VGLCPILCKPLKRLGLNFKLALPQKLISVELGDIFLTKKNICNIIRIITVRILIKEVLL